MIALAVSAKEEQLIVGLAVAAAIIVEVLNPLRKPLPLSFGTMRIEYLVRWVSPIDQAKIRRCL